MPSPDASPVVDWLATSPRARHCRAESLATPAADAVASLSDPPRYTAGPNPLLASFLAPLAPGTGGPSAPVPPPPAPFAADVSEGKRDPIYNAHAYHTKVPHRAIMRYILHYTQPGDVVFDGFCGSGMAGVAALACGDRGQLEALGLSVGPDGEVRTADGERVSRLGARRAVLSDLSPAATFIAAGYTAPADPEEFRREAERILAEVEAECGRFYATLHQPTPGDVTRAVDALKHGAPAPDLSWARIRYTVWSEVFTCPECGEEATLYAAAADPARGVVRDRFPCPHCGASCSKREMRRAFVERWDPLLGEHVRQVRIEPVLIRYAMGRKTFDKAPDDYDRALLASMEEVRAPYPVPVARLPEGDKTREPIALGLTHVHHLYTPRSLFVLAGFAARARAVGGPVGHRLLMAFTGVAQGDSMLNRYLPRETSFPFYLLSGTLYVGGLRRENCPLSDLRNKALLRLAKLPPGAGADQCVISTHSATDPSLMPDESVDYIFTDPPFGGNLQYSELSFLWEAWLGVFTDGALEAVTSPTRGKTLDNYRELMTRCFAQFRRVLKPRRTMTVVFHNSSNRVWDAIHEALKAAGFVIVEIRTLDKREGTFNQIAGGASVRQDLVISAFRSEEPVCSDQPLTPAEPDSAWEFVRARLADPDLADDERRHYLLFDRMVAHHIRNGMQVPLSAAEFYAGLRERFAERDGLHYLLCE